MAVPSERAILERLEWLDKLHNEPRLVAKLVRQAMLYDERGTVGRELASAIKRDSHLPVLSEDDREDTRHDAAMEALDEILETHGVEYLASSRDSYNEARGVEYLNTGDPYTATVLYDLESGRYSIGCWGDLVERSPRRFGDE